MARPSPAIFTALSEWWIRSVLRGLQVARDMERLDFFELGFGEWQAWEAYASFYDENFTPAENGVLTTQRTVNLDVASAAAAAVARRTLVRCVGPGVPRSALRNILRLASAVNLAELPIDQSGANDGTGRSLPNGRNLPTACLDVELTAVEHAAALARNRDNRFVASARIAFSNGPASTTIPLRYRIADTTNAPVAVASGTSSTGSYADTLNPAALGTRHYELTVDLDSTGSDTVLRTFFAQLDFSVPVRERLDLQARRPGDAAFADLVGAVAPGGTVSLRVRLAGDDAANKTITITHDGSGTVPASVTTDANGEALASYVAPAADQIELVNATVTEGAFTSGDALVITIRQAVTVTVAPAFGFASSGGTVQFSASVANAPTQAVTCTAAGGSIDANGLYTAGSSSGTFAVTARSAFDPSVTGTAFVQVSEASPLTIISFCGAVDRPPAEFTDRVFISVLNAVGDPQYTLKLDDGLTALVNRWRQVEAIVPANGQAVSATWTWTFSFFSFDPENPEFGGVRALLSRGPCQGGYVYRG